MFFFHIFITKAQISCSADQHLCVHYMNSTIPLILNPIFFQPLGPKNEVCYNVIYYIFFYYSLSFQSKEVILTKERSITPNTLSSLYIGRTFSPLVEPW